MVTHPAPGLSHPDIVSSPLRQAVAEHVLALEAPAVAHHSLRSYFFATELAVHRGLRRGVDYDDDTLFYATVLHDLGLSDAGEARPGRFEVAGADMAAEFLQSHGVAAETIEIVWEAIALHTAADIAPRRGIICRLNEAGIALDGGRDSDFLSDEEAAVINDAFPRLDFLTIAGPLIIRQAERNRAKAPHLSTADYFYRSVHGFGDLSFLSRWGAT